MENIFCQGYPKTSSFWSVFIHLGHNGPIIIDIIIGVLDEESEGIHLYRSIVFVAYTDATYIIIYRTYLKKGFCLSVKSLKAILSLWLSSRSIRLLRLFSLASSIYNAAAAAMVMQ